MLIKKPSDILPSEITDESVYLNRRQFLTGLTAASALATTSSLFSLPVHAASENPGNAAVRAKLSNIKKGVVTTDEALTPYEDVTKYNNFYEFGTDKSDPHEYAGQMKVDPWSVKIDGEVGKPGTLTLDDLLKPHTLEERIYRIRCVEAWSMVVPWIGFPLGDLLKRFEPTSRAKYVAFETLYAPDEMPGTQSAFTRIDWPYVEGLRMDEAMHPLAILAVGLYGKVMPNQNGAPIRLVVPWKYGFKSIKSIVGIHLTEKQPPTTWNTLQSNEYGFYANVNPEVDHPRWSQKTERRLPSTLFGSNRIPTRKFNGYADQVAQLYTGMDLRKFF